MISTSHRFINLISPPDVFLLLILTNIGIGLSSSMLPYVDLGLSLFLH